RIFQGHHWLYHVATGAGVVTVIRQNSGEAQPSEGANVRITWRGEDMSRGGKAPRRGEAMTAQAISAGTASPGDEERRSRAPYLLVLPALLLFVGIVLIPIAMTILLSFHDWG